MREQNGKTPKPRTKRKGSLASGPSPSDNPTLNNARASKDMLLLKVQSPTFAFSGASAMAAAAPVDIIIALQLQIPRGRQVLLLKFFSPFFVC